MSRSIAGCASVTNCPICRGSARVYGHTPEADGIPSLALYSCGGCCHVWKADSTKRPAEFASNIFSREFAVKGAEVVLRHLPDALVSSPAVRVLDVGCWDGALLMDLPDTWVRHGIELNRRAAKLAQSRGIKVCVQRLESAPLDSKAYDVVILMDILEHLEDPLGCLGKVGNALAPGGYLVALTGDATALGSRLYRGYWYYFYYEEHVSFFSPRSLSVALKKTGLEVIEISKVAHHTATLHVTTSRLARRLRGMPKKGEDALPLPVSRLALVRLAASRLLRGRDHLFMVARNIV